MFEDDNQQSELSWSRLAGRERQAFLKQQLETWREENPGKRADYNSLRYRLLEELTQDAVAKVSESDPRRQHELEDKLWSADHLVGQLCDAATSYEREWDKREQLNFWQHAWRPADDIRRKNYKLTMKGEVEGAASYYLDQPLRSQLFDRILVDMLIAQELYAFADEMIHPLKFPGLPVNSPLKQPHPLWQFIRDNLISAAILGGIAWVVSSTNWGGVVAGVLLVIWVIGAVWSIFALPVVWSRWLKARKKVLTLLDSMLTTYAQMQSDSVISASHVLDTVKASAAAGAVWPSPLFVLLEDVMRRGGKL